MHLFFEFLTFEVSKALRINVVFIFKSCSIFVDVIFSKMFKVAKKTQAKKWTLILIGPRIILFSCEQLFQDVRDVRNRL
jgi:hypothetical protein